MFSTRMFSPGHANLVAVLTSVVMRFLCVPSDNAGNVMVSGFVSEQLTSSITAVFSGEPD